MNNPRAKRSSLVMPSHYVELVQKEMDCVDERDNCSFNLRILKETIERLTGSGIETL